MPPTLWSRLPRFRSLFSRQSSSGLAAKYAALNYPGHVNLGDEIQTIAALRFLPRVDAWIGRERLNEFTAEYPHKILLNGWFLHRPEHWPPSPSLAPLIISFHLTREIHSGYNKLMIAPSSTVLSPEGLNYLHRHAPIGARDLDTLAQLQSVGVPAYFSGCLTLTLQRPEPDPERTDVYAVDVPDEVFAHFGRTFDRPIIRLSHVDTELQGDARFARASELLRLYAAAKAVITCRLHCALPCLALNTPVLFIENATDGYRFAGLKDLLRCATIDEVLHNRCDFDLRSPPPNGTAWHIYRDDLVARCATFVQN